MKLSPPPKVVSPVGSPGSPRDRSTSGRRGPAFWVTAGVFAVLGSLAIAVFLVLPGWVAERSATQGRTADATPAAAELETEAAPPQERDVRTRQAQTPTTQTPATQTPATQTPATQTPAPPEPAPQEPTLRDPALQEPLPEPADPTPAAPQVEPTEAPATRATATQQEFAHAMASGLAALDRADLAAARRDFEAAAALAPESTAPAEGLARVAAAEQREAILGHRGRAESFAADEDWSRARAEYAAVLALDPAIRFAQIGEAHAALREAVTRGLDEHLSRPERLSTEAVLEEARKALDRAEEIPDPGPALRERIARLEQAVAEAETPVRVVLLSDGLTDILVYRVGRLGRFERRELDLRPGTYTVVGAREGYRDVRHQLRVAADGSTASLTVRCEERI